MSDNVMQSSNSTEQKILKGNNLQRLNLTTAVTQLFVWPFLFIDLFMLIVFLRRRTLRSEARYVLFAQSLVGDSMFLLMTDFVILSIHVHFLLPISVCIPFLLVLNTVTQLSPTVITVMCVELYVAVCMPLRHVNIFSPGRTKLTVAIIWIISFIKPFIDLCIFLSIVSKSYFRALNFCYYEILFVKEWQMFMRAYFYIVNFVVILLILLFCYVSIIIAAKRASGESKAAAAKGRRTLSLHFIQLIFCTLKIMTPYIEARVMAINLDTFLIVRYFNFIAFALLARSISPLIYGFRDEKFYIAMKYYAGCQSNHISSSK